jgi:hypothetical protein
VLTRDAMIKALKERGPEIEVVQADVPNRLCAGDATLADAALVRESRQDDCWQAVRRGPYWAPGAKPGDKSAASAEAEKLTQACFFP